MGSWQFTCTNVVWFDLVNWIDRAAAEVPVDSLSDGEILGSCDMQIVDEDQKALSHLLALNREGQRDDAARSRLDAMMQINRRGLVRKMPRRGRSRRPWLESRAYVTAWRVPSSLLQSTVP